MKKIAVTCEKGGVGKTTTAVNISAMLAMRGHRVLLIDLDPQSYATTYYNLYDDARASIFEVMIGDCTAQEAVRSTNIAGLDIIPSKHNFEYIESYLSGIAYGPERVLLELIRPIENDYDIAIIDCPPAGVRVKINAITAADALILPVIPDHFALRGLVTMAELLGNMRRITGDRPVLGVVITMDEQTNNKIAYKNAIRQQNLYHVFSTTIRKNTTLSEAINAHQPIHIYAPKSNGAIDYTNLTAEILEVL